MSQHRYNLILHIDYDLLPDAPCDVDAAKRYLERELSAYLRRIHREPNSPVVVQNVSL
jgi:hypothetical protein